MVGRWIFWWVAIVTLGLLATGGCARVITAWNELTKPIHPPLPPAAPPQAIAQGEDSGPAAEEAPRRVFGDSVVTPAGVANSRTRVPVVNVFGEVDGNPVNPGTGVAEPGFQQHTYLDEGYDADVCVDPTGKWLVFASTRHSEKTDIYLQRVDGMSVTQLTSDAAEDSQPTFSPDGQTIAFASTRSGRWAIYTMDPDGRNVVQVTNGPAHEMHPSFSPDGRRLAYCSLGIRSGQWELWIVNLKTREKKMIGYGLFPSWSPDKSVDRIAFQRARQRGTRWFSLWTLDLVEGEPRRVTELAVSSNAAIVSPGWNRDGSRLAFATIADPVGEAKNKKRAQQDIWVVNSDGGNRVRLTDGNGTCLTPCWSNDNRVYFISDRAGHETVWSVRAEGRSHWPVASDPRKEPSGKSATGTAPSSPAAANAPTAIGSGDASELSK